jgi:Tfp pilus assembly protein PilF
MMAGTSNDAALANRLGLDALRSGDARAASEHFERACRADPAAADLQINLATAQRLLKDDAAERAALEAALSIDQRNLMALIRLAQLH